jgi:hypothetical protein
LNTAFIERLNLTVRHGCSALARRTWATSQQASQLLAHLEWFRAYYHFVRQQQDSDGASLWERKACPDCSITNIQPEVGLERLVDLSIISNRNTVFLTCFCCAQAGRGMSP